MILDLSGWSTIIGYVSLGIVAIVLLFTLIHCTKTGIIKSLIRLVYIAILVAMLVFLTPIVTNWLSPIGFASYLTQYVSFIDDHLIYVICAVIAILIVFLIVRAILARILKKVTEKKFKLNNLIGFIYGVIWFFVVSVVYLDIVASPLVIGGAMKGINNTPVISLYNQKAVQPLFDVFDNEGWTLTARSYYLNGSGLVTSEEEREDYLTSFRHYEEFLVDEDAYKASLKENDTYVDSKVIAAVREFNLVAKVALSQNEYVYEKLQSGMGEKAALWASCLPDIELPSDLKDELMANLEALNVTPLTQQEIADKF